MKKFILIVALLFASCQYAFALDIEEDAVFARTIDVGAGLCVVVRMPGDHYMVFDAGDWRSQGKVAFDGIEEVIPDGEEIDLLVLSHSDGDHQGAVKRIFDKYKVKKVLRGGLERFDTEVWRRSNKAIRDAHTTGETLDIRLKYFEFPMGATYRFGDTFVTMVSGFYAPPEHWDIKGGKTGSEFRNAGSIVIRLLFKGKSILITGDAVGRHIDDPDNALIASEKFMIENSEAITIDSDVLIAPHHGADNGSSTAFIEAVSPEAVIFSAGHAHKHPRKNAVKRYITYGIDESKIFRTDLGDDEGIKEWSFGRIENNKDKARDDDVDILIRPNGELVVEYRN